ncbi:hypothetical protein ACFO4E_09790 [Nocardiopsis mangrovi]|uniref:DUF427 domain-containing protein n=1 Tax=Nocardiopsis mangrovi TaxID=1179818 RepID=A0ABV9DTV0_9ACTN
MITEQTAAWNPDTIRDGPHTYVAERLGRTAVVGEDALGRCPWAGAPTPSTSTATT